MVPVACKVNKYVTGLFVNIEFVEFNVVYKVGTVYDKGTYS